MSLFSLPTMRALTVSSLCLFCFVVVQSSAVAVEASGPNDAIYFDEFTNSIVLSNVDIVSLSQQVNTSTLASQNNSALIQQATIMAQNNKDLIDSNAALVLENNEKIANNTALAEDTYAQLIETNAILKETNDMFRGVFGPRWSLADNTVWSIELSFPTVSDFLSTNLNASVSDPNGMNPLVFELVDDTALPAGLELDSSGVVTGAFHQSVRDECAARTGDHFYVLALRVTNALGVSTAEDLTIVLHLWTDLTLLAHDAGSTQFGARRAAVSFDGSTMLISAYATNSNEGAVYEYTWDTETAAFSNATEVGDPATLGASAQYGADVGLSDDGLVVLVAMPWDGDFGSESGAAVFLTRNSTNYTFSEPQKVFSTEPSGFRTFSEGGVHVTPNGTRGFVGAPLYTADAINQGGAVFVYEWNNNTEQFDRDQIVLPETRGANTRFGSFFSVSSDGVYLAVSTDDIAGDVYLFRHNGTEYQQIQMFPQVDCAPGTGEMYSMSLSGDGSLLAFGQQNCGDSYAGEVHMFSRTNATNYELVQIIEGANDTVSNDKFGFEVILSRDGLTLIASAPFQESEGAFADAGAVYTFTYSAEESMFVETRKFVAHEPEDYLLLGQALTLSGDGTTLFASTNKKAMSVFTL